MDCGIFFLVVCVFIASGFPVAYFADNPLERVAVGLHGRDVDGIFRTAFQVQVGYGATV